MGKLNAASQKGRSRKVESAQEEMRGIILDYFKVTLSDENVATQVLNIIKSNGYGNDVCLTALIAMKLSDYVRTGNHEAFKGEGTFEQRLDIYGKSISALKSIKGFTHIAHVAQLLSVDQAQDALYKPKIELDIHIPNCEGCGEKLTYREEWLTLGKGEIDIEFDCTNPKCKFIDSIYNSFRNMVRLTMV